MCVNGVHDVEDDVRLVVRPSRDCPVEVGRVSLSAVRRPGEVGEAGFVVALLVHIHITDGGVNIVSAFLGFNPEAVVPCLLKGLAVGENPGVLVRLQIHLEVIGHCIHVVVDHQPGIGLAIRAVDHRGPDEEGLVLGAVARADVHVLHGQFATGLVDVLVIIRVVIPVIFLIFMMGILIIVRLLDVFIVVAVVLAFHWGIVAGVAAAVFLTFTVVPASEVVVSPGHGLRRNGHRPATRVQLVQGQMEVRTRMVRTGTAFDIASVTDCTDLVTDVDLFTFPDIDVRQVSVATVVVVAMVDDDRVAIALITVAVVGHDVDSARSDRSHGLAVGLTAGLGEVQSVGIVAEPEVVVHVAGLVEAAGDHPVLAGNEGEGQAVTRPTDSVAVVVIQDGAIFSTEATV